MSEREEPPVDDTSQRKSTRAGAASVCGAFLSAFDELRRAVAPAENVERHFREARKQALMGLRQLIDNRIQAMSGTETKGAQAGAK